MKLKNLIQRIFCKDLLDRVAKLEETVTNITAERDALSDQLAAAELANNILRTERTTETPAQQKFRIVRAVNLASVRRSPSER